MKKFLLVVAGITSLIAIILCFQNWSLTAQVNLFFSSKQTELFKPLFILFSIGIVSGFSLGISLMSKTKESMDNF